MARKRLVSWLGLPQFVHFLSLCILFIQSGICASQHVRSSEEASVKHENNMSTVMYLNTSSDVTIRVGELLQLNCTIVGETNLSKGQLSWYRDNQRLTNLTRKISNETIQLEIDQVSWISNGTYVCRENGNRVEPKSVMVRVGDIPSSPQDVWINNVEFRTYIHWKAPLHPGGLQLNYAVKGQCENASTQLPECEHKSITLCEVIKIDPGPESDQFVCKVSAILHQFAPVTFAPVIYLAFIEASNELGSMKSNPVEFTINLGFNVLSTTPQPAVFLAAEEVAPPGTVKLTWEDAKRLRPKAVEYTILYHKDGDLHNRSLTVKPPQTNCLISGLVGFSRFHFYLLVRYGEKKTGENTTTYGIYSKAAERSVRTNISAPRGPAAITNCSHWSNLSRDPGLMITWTISQAEYFNGPLKSAVIFYRCQRGRRILIGNVTVSNLTAHRAVITAVKPYDKCHVWMKLCNEPGLCSGISNMCLISSILKDNSSPTSKNSKESTTKTVWTILAGVAGGLTLVILMIMCYRRRNNGNKLPPLSNVLVMPTVIHGYDEIEQPLLNNNLYDVINVESLE